jgi:predicted transcriptional regulator YdeE
MEKIVLTEPIDLVCITAKSFPEGIQEAFDTLGSQFPAASGYTFFGISYCNGDGSITYKAAVEDKKGEEIEMAGLETFTIPSGIYWTETIENFMEKISLVGETFRELLNNPQLEEFPCIEWYRNSKDVICMVKINE